MHFTSVDSSASLAWDLARGETIEIVGQAADEGVFGAEPTDVSPSLIYATAAALEGCNFVNGGSQNTVCAGLVELCAAN